MVRSSAFSRTAESAVFTVLTVYPSTASQRSRARYSLTRASLEGAKYLFPSVISKKLKNMKAPSPRMARPIAKPVSLLRRRRLLRICCYIQAAPVFQSPVKIFFRRNFCAIRQKHPVPDQIAKTTCNRRRITKP